jgi:hypothetical protein
VRLSKFSKLTKHIVRYFKRWSLFMVYCCKTRSNSSAGLILIWIRQWQIFSQDEFLCVLFLVSKLRSMANICIFLYLCWYSDNFHDYFYDMPEILSSDQVSRAIDWRNSISSIIIYSVSMFFNLLVVENRVEKNIYVRICCHDFFSSVLWFF